MSFGGKPRNKEENLRFDSIKHGNCMACLLMGQDVSGQGLVEVHHLLSGGRRIGHMATIGLCVWHHRGVNATGAKRINELRQCLGPSLAEGSKPFHKMFGTDKELLSMQNAILGGDDGA